MDDEEAELRNPFPAPPALYARYTQHNLDLLALLRERIQDSNIDDVDLAKQDEILVDQQDLPDWPLAQLEKPRADWIVQDGFYNVYGDTWFVRPTCSISPPGLSHRTYVAQRDTTNTCRGRRRTALSSRPIYRSVHFPRNTCHKYILTRI
jgi:mediator of RNA polymerase II transcription subunit 7